MGRDENRPIGPSGIGSVLKQSLPMSHTILMNNSSVLEFLDTIWIGRNIPKG
jgi:hypothetical protein